MTELDLKALVEAYLDAFDRRDLATCLSFFADEAKIDMGMGTYQGAEALETWHQERFEADLRILKIDKITQKTNQVVVVDGAASSKLMRAWRFKSLSGRGTLTFENGKIIQAKFGLRSVIPIEAWG